MLSTVSEEKFQSISNPISEWIKDWNQNELSSSDLYFLLQFFSARCSCLEDLYWQCFEEKYCYDEEIGEFEIILIIFKKTGASILVTPEKLPICYKSINQSMINF